MEPKKVNLQWIPNKLTRCATYKRRCRSLMKKADELAEATGAKVSVVVYNEDDVDARLEVYPSTLEAARLFKKLKQIPDGSSFKKTTTQLEYLGDRLVKVSEQVDSSKRENCKRETSELLHEHMIGHRPGLIGATDKEVLNLKGMVDTRKSQAIARLKRLGIGQGVCPPMLLDGCELGAVVYSALTGSGGSGGPSGSRSDVMQVFNQGSSFFGFR